MVDGVITDRSVSRSQFLASDLLHSSCTLPFPYCIYSCLVMQRLPRQRKLASSRWLCLGVPAKPIWSIQFDSGQGRWGCRCCIRLHLTCLLPLIETIIFSWLKMTTRSSFRMSRYSQQILFIGRIYHISSRPLCVQFRPLSGDDGPMMSAKRAKEVSAQITIVGSHRIYDRLARFLLFI